MNFDDMSDEEIVESINESLAEDGRITTDYLNVECVNGKPIVSGRVPSDEELQVLDEIMKDVLEVEAYENTVWVDDSLAFEGSEDEETQPVSFDEEEGMEPDDGFEGSDEDDE
ncbi:BON domain-containing protein [bacterium]|nr:BON domain-containing protein [bacterium]